MEGQLSEDERFDLYYDLYYNTDKRNETLIEDVINKYMTCEFCNIDLLIDYHNYYNLCPNCNRCYPFCDGQNPRFSIPYKRKWHMMSIIRKNNFHINGYEIEKIMNFYNELDRLYYEKFPKKNMVYLLFVLQFICKKLNYNHIAGRIKINKKENKLKQWGEKLNLVLNKL